MHCVLVTTEYGNVMPINYPLMDAKFPAMVSFIPKSMLPIKLILYFVF